MDSDEPGAADARSLLRHGINGEDAPRQFGPLLHGGQPQSGERRAVARNGCGIETAAVIRYQKIKAAFCLLERDRGEIRSAVFGDIVERLLNDPVDDDSQPGGNICFFYSEVDLDPDSRIDLIICPAKPLDGF